MGTALTGLQIGSTYNGLLKTTDNAVINGTLRVITDGLGNNTALEVSTAGVKSSGTLDVTGVATLGAGAILNTPASGNLANCTGYVGTSALVTTGALNSGSITSGFGSIDVGADSISGGAISGTTVSASTRFNSFSSGSWMGSTAVQGLYTQSDAGLSELAAGGIGQQPSLTLFRASGTIASMTATASGSVGNLRFQTYDGSAVNTSAQLRFETLALHSGTERGTKATLVVTPLGSTTAINSMVSDGTTLTIAPTGTTVGTFTSTGLNSTVIGATTPAAGSFTTVSATGASSFPGLKGQKTTATSGFISSIDEGVNTYNVLGSRNNADNAYLPLVIRGTTVTLGATSDIATVSSTGLAVTGSVSSTTGANFATSSGNVGIGTSSPGNYFFVVEKASDLTETTAHMRIIGSGYSALHWLDGTAYYIGQNSGSRELRMYSGTSSTTGVKLTAGATSWASISDERAKDIIEPIVGALAKVASLRTVIGRYKIDPQEKRRAFLIAQDVEKVLPEAVHTDANGEKSLSYTEVIPLIVSAFKEVVADNDSLRARLAKLEAK